MMKRIADDVVLKIWRSFNRDNRSIVSRAAWYTLSSGHRYRPMLLLATAQRFEPVALKAEKLAAVVEMTHAASLVLDDLPCMDNTAERHGQPACHVKFGEATAILASHELIRRCWVILADFPPGLSKDFGRVLGEMLRGQELNLAARRPSDKVNGLKTASLFALSASWGALAGGAGKTEQKKLERFGYFVGMAYQAADDAADEGSSSAKIKKYLKKAEELNRFGDKAVVLQQLVSSIFQKASQ